MLALIFGLHKAVIISMSVVFRWSAWGQKHRIIEQLQQSIMTFRHCFGSLGRYVLCTDEPNDLAPVFHGIAEVLDMRSGSSPQYYDVVTRATWRKWCPFPRIAPGHTEIMVDSDVFIVGDPHELRQFCEGQPGDRVLALEEYPSASRWSGVFQLILDENSPAINAGIFGQQPNVDITSRLNYYFQWWYDRAAVWDGLFHDEQGAINAIAAEYMAAGKLDMLPSSRYLMVDS